MSTALVTDRGTATVWALRSADGQIAFGVQRVKPSTFPRRVTLLLAKVVKNWHGPRGQLALAFDGGKHRLCNRTPDIGPPARIQTLDL